MGVSASVAGKIFSNIKYLNISYSDELQQALLNWKSNFLTLGFSTNMPDVIEERIVERSVPYVFEKYDVPSSFLVNLYQQLSVLVIILLVFIGIKVLEWALKSFKTGHRIFYTLRIMIQNFIITQLYGLYGDLVLYSSLEYRSMNLKLGVTGLSFGLSVVLLGVMLGCFAMHWYFLRKYQSLKRASGPDSLKEFSEKNKGSQVFMEDFRDESIVQQSFLLFLTFRDIAFSLLLTTLFEYPMIQTLLIFSFGVIMIIYLWVCKPFKNKFGLFQQGFYELVALVVNINIIILAFADQIDAYVYEMRQTIGKLIIIVNAVFNFGTVLLMITGLALIGKEAYQEYKMRQRRKTRKLKTSFNSTIEGAHVKEINRNDLRPPKLLNSSMNLGVNTANTMEDFSLINDQNQSRKFLVPGNNHRKNVSWNEGEAAAEGVKRKDIHQLDSQTVIIRRNPQRDQQRGNLKESFEENTAGIETAWKYSQENHLLYKGENSLENGLEGPKKRRLRVSTKHQREISGSYALESDLVVPDRLRRKELREFFGMK